MAKGVSLSDLETRFKSLNKDVREGAFADITTLFEAVNYDIPENQMEKIVAGLDFYLWHAAKPSYQDKVVMDLVYLPLKLASRQNGILYLEYWWKRLIERWPTVDKHRKTKYLGLARKLTELSIDLMTTEQKPKGKKTKKLSKPVTVYDDDLVALVVDAYIATLLAGKKTPFDLLSHVIFVFLDAIDYANVPVPVDVLRHLFAMWIEYLFRVDREGLIKRFDEDLMTPALEGRVDVAVFEDREDDAEQWSLGELAEIGAGSEQGKNRRYLRELAQRVYDLIDAGEGSESGDESEA
ncbi:Nucleolar, Nop52 [Carpediemonas membranifera]|uniref:Nucleolar, Nop52 n=1 Tax=Carpediemonas membranifera TaxID=201153 RepID=A0A8J6AXX0_9EUKA|nr:Nucleolar, Nop52 [Carpediemonas membranifera]|eukprot:KAG9394200.1 Nucleolar, Nop52 [Carpediemonas membranifera]